MPFRKRKKITHSGTNQNTVKRQRAESLRKKIEMAERSNFRGESPSESATIKISDDANSDEMLVCL